MSFACDFSLFSYAIVFVYTNIQLAPFCMTGLFIPRTKFMGPSAFGQIEAVDFENRCCTGILGDTSLFFVFEISFMRI